MAAPTPLPYTPDQLQSYREHAVAMARLGGGALHAMFGQAIGARRKTGARDLVTEADLASERAILGYIEQHFPEHGWVSEEAGTREAASPLRWVIDPLDGTANFAHGYPHFSVSIALLHDQRSIVGVVFDPQRDECFEASLGGGAALNGRPILVSGIDTLEEALVSTGFSYEPTRRTMTANLTARAIERVQMLRRGGSAALDLAYVAAGRAEAHWEWQLNLHDVAAGLLLVHEAGGVALDLHYAGWHGGYLAANSPTTAAAIGAIIDEFLGPTERHPARVISGGAA